jgi:hypothetical protein
MDTHAERIALFAVLATLAFAFAGCASQAQPEPTQTYKCPTGEIVDALSKCPAVLPEPANEGQTGGQETLPEPGEGNEPQNGAEPAQPEQPGVPECGNDVCAENETFGTCKSDCAPTYRYLYEYTEALTYSYQKCDRIGDRTNCWEETTYVERAEPYFKGSSAKPYYSMYNSYTLRTINGSGSEQTIKTWVNNTSSECMLSFEQVPMKDRFYNSSAPNRFYVCPKIISVEYIGDDSNVDVPLASFSRAQKFKVTYVEDPNAAFPKTETMMVWKVPGPLPDYAGYTFMTHGNIRVPIMTAREWSYINNQGIEIHVFSNATLKTYVEPVEFGG